jgi:hypothetical protein
MRVKPKQIKFKYIFDDDYNPSYASGAFGGPTPRDEIVINFFLERQPVPYSETRAVNEDGTLGATIKAERNDDTLKIIRYVETGVVMDLKTAREIHTWLGETIKLIDKNKGEK